VFGLSMGLEHMANDGLAAQLVTQKSQSSKRWSFCAVERANHSSMLLPDALLCWLSMRGEPFSLRYPSRFTQYNNWAF